MSAGPRLLLHRMPDAGPGWGPIGHLAGMMQRLLGAEEAELRPGRYGRLRRLRRTLLQPDSSGEDILLYILHHPGEIATVVTDPAFDRPAAMRVLWIVDSFCSERTPPGLIGNFDLVVFMQSGETEFYDQATNGRALFVGWGADVLELGSNRADRPVDVLRVGRQPAIWDDDERSAKAAARRGLRFQGRPPGGTYAELMEWYSRARFVVAFSNLVAPAGYTHPTKAYFTGRWLDALAGGAVVAGIAPMEDRGIADRLWDRAFLEFDSIDMTANMDLLAREASAWTPERALVNHRNALLRFDWRHGLKRFADRLGLEAPALERELEQLQDRAHRLAATA